MSVFKPAGSSSTGVGSSAGAGRKFYDTGTGGGGMGIAPLYRPTGTTSSEASAPESESGVAGAGARPGVISINPVDPGTSVEEAGFSIQGMLGGLWSGVFGQSQPDKEGKHGGPLGGIPIVSDLARAAGESVSNVGGAVLGAAGEGLEQFNQRTSVGSLFGILPQVGRDAGLKEQFDAIPETWSRRDEFEKAMDKGILGTGVYSNEAHVMSEAIRAFKQDVTAPGFKPTYQAGKLTTPGSIAQELNNIMDLFDSFVAPGRRTAAGIQNIQGNDRLAQAEALVDGMASTGLGGTGVFSGQQGATVIEQLAVQKVRSKEWSRDEALDFLSSNGSGWSHDPGAELLGDVFGDPTFVPSFGLAAGVKAAKFGSQVNASIAKAAGVTSKATEAVAAAEKALAATRSAGGAKKATRVLDKAKAALDDATKAESALTTYQATKTPRGLNKLATAAEGSEKVQDFFKLAGRVYDGAQGTHIGRMGKAVRTLIDPLHAIDLRMPGNARMVDLLSDSLPKVLVDTLGANHHGALLDHAAKLDATGSFAQELTDDLGTAITNRGRDGVMDLFVASHMDGELGDLVKATNPDGTRYMPDDAFDRAVKSTREKDLLRWLREDVTKNVLKVDWTDGARRLLAHQMETLYHLQDAKAWLKDFERMSNEQLSFYAHAVYGRANKQLLDGISNSATHPSAAAFDLNRVVLLAKTTFTKVGAESLLAKLDKAKTTRQAVDLIRDAQDRFPALRNIPINPANPGKSVRAFKDALAESVDGLPMQVTKEDLAKMHDEVKDLAASLDGAYDLGFRPKDEFRWGIERSNKAGGGYYRAGGTWLDHVGGGVGYRPVRLQDLNIMGKPVVGVPLRAGAKMVDSMTAATRMLKAQVSGQMIAEVARKRFVSEEMRGAFKAHGLTESVAESWWKRIHEYVSERQGYSGPRGLGKEELYRALFSEKLIPQRLLNPAHRLTENDLLLMVLKAYDGDIRYIGLTQKLTGRAKVALSMGGQTNFAGQVAEHLWPTMKFLKNPMFQLQEKLEPFILNAQRGVDVATGATLSEADKATENFLRRLTDNSIIRQGDIFDQAEYAGQMLHGKTIRLTSSKSGSAMSKFNSKAASVMDVQGVKRLNQMRTFRKGLGKEIRQAWDGPFPGRFDDMLTDANARAGRIIDEDEFALQLFGENLLANDIVLDRLARTASKLDNFDNAIKTGAWHWPTHMGDMQPLDLDHVARAMAIPGEGGAAIKDLVDLRRYVAADHSRVGEVTDFLLGMGASPDYARRVENALTFSWTGFWKTAAERFAMTGDESAALQDMVAGAAELRGMQPTDFLSQLFAPGIEKGTEGILGTLDAPLDLLREETRSIFEATAGVSTREDFIRQLSKTFSNYLDPSAKRALLMEFEPELLKAVKSGTIRLDMREVTAMWDDLAEDQLASRIIGYMDGKPGSAAFDAIDEVETARGIAAVRDGKAAYLKSRGVTPLSGRRDYLLDADVQRHYDDAASGYRDLPAIEYERNGYVPNSRTVQRADLDLKPKPVGVDDRTYEAYEAFVQDTRAQWGHMTAPKEKGGMGIKVTVSKGDPYTPDEAGRAIMNRDISKGRLKVKGTDSSHPLMTNDQNVMFRAVHDVFGRSADDFQFGPRGELNAAASHAAMYSDEGRAALLTETHGQTAYNNFSDDVIPDTSFQPLREDDFIADYTERFPSPDDDDYNLMSEDFNGDPVDITLSIPGPVGPGMQTLEPDLSYAILSEYAVLQEMFPDYRLRHLDVFDAFEDPAEGLGLAMDNRTMGVAFGSEGNQPVIFLNPRYFDEADGAGWAGQHQNWLKSMEANSFGAGPRKSAPGTPWNAMAGPSHTIRHEMGHAVLGRIRGLQRPFPENKLVNDLLDDFVASPEAKLVSEYGNMGSGHVSGLDSEVEPELLSDLFSIMLATPEELQYAGVHIKAAEWGDKLRKALIDSGHMTPAGAAQPFAGQTVRAANAAKRGSYYAPQKAGILPQSVLDEFGEKFVGVGKHVESNPDVARTAQMFGKWTTRVVENGLLGGAGKTKKAAIHADILEEAGRIPTGQAVPYDQTQASLRQLATSQMADKWRDSFRLQYFKQERTMLERSINHPMFGMYPASYMWGKIGPELIQFLGQRSFGLRTGAMAYGMQDVMAAVALQREFDPEFDAEIEKMGHSQALSFLGYMLPTLPWEVGASAPIWMKDIAAEGTANSQVGPEGTYNDPSLTKPLVDVVEKLNPLETTIPWAGKAVEGLVDLLPGESGEEEEKGPVSGAELGGPLARAMQELQEALGK